MSEIVIQANKKNIEVLEVEFISVQTHFNSEKKEEISQLLKSNNVPVVFTSGHAVESIEKYLHNNKSSGITELKIYCLSGRTKSLIESSESIIGQIIGTGKNAIDLSNEIIRRKEKEVIFFCGDQRRDELPEMLKEQGIKVSECIIYETIETPSVISERFDGILFFSPSAVKSFFSANQLHEKTVCFAIGDTTGKTIEGFTSNQVVVSKKSSQESIMQELYKYCNKRKG